MAEENIRAIDSFALQPHLTIKEIANSWGISESTALRLFISEPGVLRIGNIHSRKRTKISIRVPLAVAERVYRKLTGQTAA